MKNPFIPIKKANIVIVDGRIDKQSIIALKKMNLKVVPTTKCNEVYDAISYHPDIVLHPINYNTLVVAPNVFDYYEDKLYGMGINLIRGEKVLGGEYPNNIAYNVGRVCGGAVHNFKYTDKVLLYYFKKQYLELIHVNQGYSKCSMAVVDEKAIITSDYGIYKELIKHNIDVLLIRPGYIVLENFDYGFIGGVCGNLSPNEIIFSGSYEHHIDGHKINKFLKKYNKVPIIINKKPMVDIGTIITLYCN